WNGETYTESGVYTYESENEFGCTNVATLTLTINGSSTSSETITACDSYDWNGETYTESGVYTYESENEFGCTNVATLTLTIECECDPTNLLAPSSFNLTNLTPSSATISWNDVETAQYYTIVYNVPGFAWEYVDVYGTSFDFEYISNTESSLYFYIRSICGEFISEWSSLQTFELAQCELTLELSSQDASCLDNDGIITAEVSGSFGEYFIDYGDINPNSVGSGTYSVTVTDEGGCSTTSHIVVNSEADPIINLLGDDSFCSNSSTTLSIEEEFLTYQWYDMNGSLDLLNTNSIVVSEPGVYYAIVTNLDGCEFTTQSLEVFEISVDVPSSLVLNLVTSFSAVIDWDNNSQSDQYNYRYSSDGGLSWTVVNNHMGSEVVLSNLLENTEYIFEVSSLAYGCVSQSTAVVFTTNVDCIAPQNVEMNVTPSSFSVSWDENINAESYTIAYSYTGGSWFIMDVYEATFSTSHNGYGAVSVYVKSNCGNDQSSTWSSLQVVSVPDCELSVSIETTDASCLDADGTIVAVVTGSYGSYVIDYDGADPSATSTGTYVLTVTDDGGCVVTQDVTVGQDQEPSIIASSDVSSFCSNETFELSATEGFDSYQWYDENGEIDGANNSIFISTTGGDFYVEVTNEAGCSFTSNMVDVFEIIVESSTEINIDDLTSNSVSIDWDAISPSGLYLLRYSFDAGNTWTTITDYEFSEINLTDLSSNQSYIFEVYSSAFGCLSDPLIASFTTNVECITPQNIQLNADPYNITISWDEVSAESYFLVYTVPGQFWNATSITESSFTIPHPGYGYAYFYVRSECDGGIDSDWSSLQYLELPSCELTLDLSSTNASCLDGDGIITANVSGAFGNYEIDFGGIDPSVVSAGTYTVSVTDDGGCEVSHDIVVGQEQTPPVTITESDNSFCEGESVVLTANDGFSSYQWYSEDGMIIDATQQTLSVIEGGEFYVEAITSEGCSSSSEIVEIFEISLSTPTSLEVVDISTNTVMLDWSETSPSGYYNVQFSDDGGSTWTIITDHYGSEINLTGLLSNTEYLFEVSSISYGCESNTISTTFSTFEDCTTPNGIQINATPSEVTFSWGAESSAESYYIVYNVSGSFWQADLVSGTSYTITHNQFGFAYFYIQSVCGDGYSSDWSSLHFAELPSCELTLDLSSTDASCLGEDGTISVDVSGSFGDYVLDYNGVDISAVAAGTYTISVIDDGGCSVSESITVNQESDPLLSVSAESLSVCNYDSNTLTANSGFSTYQWFDVDGAITGANSVSYTTVGGGEFYVVVTNEPGCSFTSETVLINEIEISSPENIEVVSVGTHFVSLDWDANSPSGYYNIQYSDDGGVTWTTISDHYGSGINLNGLSSNTDYVFEVTSSSYGCESTSSSVSFTTIEECNTPSNIEITANPANVTFSWDEVSSAESYYIVYKVSGGFWQTEVVSQTSYTVAHNQFGFAYFYIQSICGDGYSSDWSSLNFLELPSCELELDITSTDASCLGGDGTITANVTGAFGDYTIDYDGIDPSAVSQGSYTISVTDDGGCEVSHTVIIDQQEAPVVLVSESNNTFCDGESVELSASAGFDSYQWYDQDGVIEGATSQLLTVSDGGQYYVEVESLAGCASTSEISEIFEISLSAPTSLEVDDISTNTAMLDWDATSPSGYYNIQYSNDGGSTWVIISDHYGSGINLTGLLSNTEYLFEVTSVSYGCESTSSSITFTTIQGCDTPINLTLDANPQDVTLSWDQLSNAESYTVVYAASGGFWQSQSVTGNSFTFEHNGYGFAYFYIRSDCGQGYISEWSDLQIVEIPSCQLTLDLSTTDESCLGGDGTITATVNGAFGDYTIDYQGIDPSALTAGLYTISVTDDGGCSVTQTVVVEQEQTEEVSLSYTDDVICSGNTLVLTASSDFASYQWYDSDGEISGANSNEYSVSVGGDYYVTAADASGCTSTSDIAYIFEISVDAPTGLVAEEVTNDYALLDWDATSPTGAYNIEYSSDGGATWTEINDFYGSGINLNGLLSGTTYIFQVASNAYGCVSSFVSVEFTTIQVCNAPTNFSETVSSSEVELSWDVVSGAQSYEVLYNISGQGWTTETVSINSLSVSFEYGSSNFYYVRTICSDGNVSDWSPLQTFTFTCDAPTNFVISDNGGTVTFSWDDMGADEYQIIYNAGNGWIVEYISGTTLEVTNVPSFYTVYAYLRSVCNSSSNFISPWIFESHTTSSGARLSFVSTYELNVYPNPTNDIVNINISSDNEGLFNVRVVDSFGKLIFETNDQLLNGKLTYQLNLGDYANGIYMLQIITNDEVRNERIILQ
ncbi:MAG: fibronectin type III domain-containing protein, partial [Flavobacteriales bacterium]